MQHKYDYTKEVRLRHNERPAKINTDTGEIEEVFTTGPRYPQGKSALNYTHFGMLNLDLSKKLEKYLSNLELSIVFKMISRCDFNSNSLRPLNDATSIRELAEEFNLSVNSVPKVFKKLFDLGVYLQLRISENKEEKQYWVLNPYIFWRGRLKNDSIFSTFYNTDIAKLLR